MAVQLSHSINLRRDFKMPEHHEPIHRGVVNHTPTLRIVNHNSDIAKSNASQAAFQAAINRMILQKKIWEDFLEKLKQGGGGGGGSMKRLDRIAVSFMLMNYLSDKAMKAIMENFNLAFLKLQFVQNPGQIGNQDIIGNIVLKTGANILNIITNTMGMLIKNSGVQMLFAYIKSAYIKSGVGALHAAPLLAAFSFQLNKLKGIIEEELRESIRKLDVKEKIKKIKEVMNNVISVTLGYIKDLTIAIFLHDIHLNY